MWQIRQPVTEDRPLQALLTGLAGKEVVLTVGPEPKMEDTREVVVTPTRSERDLRYADWVRQNREYVLEKTGGKMGYIHVPDMMGPGLIEFNTWFYPQLDREGMVVDIRNVTRLLLQINMLGQAASVEIDLDMVEPIEEPQYQRPTEHGASL